MIRKPITLFFPLFIFCTSCAWVGSSSRLVNRPTKKIIRVAVLIVQDLNEYLTGDEREGFLFTKTIAEELSYKKPFGFIVLERQYDFTSFDLLLKSDLAKDLEGSYDAFLICHPQKKNMSNYKVEMLLVQTGNGMEILRTKHGTGFGNSYWWIESPDATLVDATKGAVDALSRKLTRHNR